MKNLIPLIIGLIFTFSARSENTPPDSTCDALISISVTSLNVQGISINLKVNTTLGNPQKFVYEYKNKFGTWQQLGATITDKDTSIAFFNFYYCDIYSFRARSECSATLVGTWKTVDFYNYLCNPNYCTHIYSINFKSYSPTSANGFWNAFGNGNYLVEYKTVSDPTNNWIRDSSFSTLPSIFGYAPAGINLKNLQPSTIYNARVISYCSLKFDTSALVSFTTLCNPVSNINSVLLNDTSIKISWKNPIGGSNNLKLKITSTKGDFINTYNLNNSDSTIIINDLPKCNFYKVSLSTQCDSASISLSDSIEFKINGCTTCKKVNQVTVTPSSYSIPVKWGSTGSGKYYVEYKIASDSIKTWWRDTTYTNADVLSKFAPSDYNTYALRVLSICNNEIDTSEVVTFQTICNSPYYLTANLLSDTVVNLNWTNPSSIYDSVSIRIISSDYTFSRIYKFKGTHAVIYDLPRCTDYTAQIKYACDTSIFINSASNPSFRILGCSTCKSTILYFKYISDYNIYGTWTEAGDGKYIVETKISSDSTSIWTRITDSTRLTNVNFYDSYGYTGRKYDVRVITFCKNTFDTSAIYHIIPYCASNLYVNSTVSSDTIVTLNFNNYGSNINNYVLNVYPFINGNTTSLIKVYKLNGNSFVINDLPKCGTYSIYAYLQCDTNSFSYPYSFLVTTTGCTKCPKITNINVNPYYAPYNQFNCSWTGTGANIYYVEYKLASESSNIWHKDSTTYPSIALTNLKSDQKYLLRIITFCQNASDTSYVTSFNTNCGYVATLNAKLTADTIITFNWSRPTPDINNFTIEVTSNDGSFKRSYSVQDSFLTLSNLPKCLKYSARIYTVCNNPYLYGYNATVAFQINGCTTCKPTNVVAQGLDSNRAVVSWGFAGDGNYKIEYKLDVDSILNWQSDTSTYPSITLNNLKPFGTYLVRILAQCSNKFDTSSIAKFQTSCPVPSNLNATVKADSIILTWDNPVGLNSIPMLTVTGNYYTVINKSVTGNSYTFRDSSRCTDFSARLTTSGCGLNAASSTSNNVYYKTFGCLNCQSATGLSVNPYDSIAYLNWNYTGDSRVTVLYKINEDSIKTWNSVQSQYNSTYLTGLNFVTSYAVRLVSVCNGISDTGAITTFRTTCPTPANFTATVTNDTVATFRWQGYSQHNTSFSVRIYSNTTSFTKSYTVTGSSLTLNNLPHCQSYYAKIYTLCGADYIAGPPYYNANFSIDGCTNCTKLSAPTISGIGQNSAQVSWNAVGSLKYYIEYKRISDTLLTFWMRDSSSTNTFSLGAYNGLYPGVKYSVRIITKCDNRFDTSAITSFRTLCPLPYYFSAFNLTDSTVVLNWGGNASNFILTIAGTTNAYSKTYKLTGSTLTVTDLPRCEVYNAYLSVQCDSNAIGNVVTSTFYIGACPPCRKVDSLIFFATSASSAFGAWNVAGTDKYIIQYKLTSDALNNWLEDSISGPIITLRKGLVSCRAYNVRVISICNRRNQGYTTDTSATTTFVIPCNDSCNTPQKIITSFSNNNVVVSWIKYAPQTNNTGAYELQYKLSTDSVWNNIIQSSTDSFTLSGLPFCQQFDVRVRAACTKTLQSDWITTSFKTQNHCLGDIKITRSSN